ncbi:hypothetical protein [Arthrobacter sp. SO5]|uniref:hypothetical protein n=1 Tax=Arthrobacter sp. SO5 TaxID=1897055 RepID=UPI001E633D4D|nr:hypothetical protein [Arthrobacter sp. SO5]
MRITKRAGYASAVALALAFPPIVLAVPAVAEPCGAIGGVIPVLICPIPSPSGPPAPPAPPPMPPAPAPPAGTAAPTTSARVLPPAPAPAAPEPAAALAPAATAGQPVTVPPAVDRSVPAPAEQTASAAPSFPAAAPRQAPGVPAEPPMSDANDGGGAPGPFLLSLGGLLLMVWAGAGLRRRA